jgi:hypothetical protein
MPIYAPRPSPAKHPELEALDTRPLAPPELLRARLKLCQEVLQLALGDPVPHDVKPPLRHAVAALTRAIGRL